MEGFATIGATYILNVRNFERSTFFVVIGNNFNDNTTILQSMEYGPDYGKKIVVEDGKEFIKPSYQKTKH